MNTTAVEARARAKRVRYAKPELLAPAGNLEKLKFAIHYGADAVFIGGQKYGLRSNADNFSIEEMREGVEFAKSYGAQVFVTTNIFAHNEDIEGLEQYLMQLEEVGIAAIIVADPLIIETCRRVAPKIEIHLSTQQSTINWLAMKFWKENGVDRVVLAREASMSEIDEIKSNVDIEIEAFIHGAMCSAWSGRCVLSNHFTDRDSNRGGCSQSCRWKYDMYAKDVPLAEGPLVEGIPLFSDNDDPFSMGSKDMYMIEHIPDLIESGIDSFKIEGRMKSIHYVATVVNAYRQAIDAYFDNPDEYQLKIEWLEEIYKAANRPLNTGFFYKVPGTTEHIYEPEDKAIGYDFVGLVVDYDAATGMATIQQRNHFKPGQEVEFFGPNGTHFKQTVEAIWDENDGELDAARHPLQIIKMKMNEPVRKWDMMRKKTGK
jgi:U32 family peptidase